MSRSATTAAPARYPTPAAPSRCEPPFSPSAGGHVFVNPRRRGGDAMVSASVREEDRMDQRIIALYDDFTHRHLDRRLFLDQATRLVGSAAALTALSLLQSNRALGQIVAPDDGRLRTMRIIYPGSTGAVKAYLARPVGDAKLPGIVVIHENRGLMPHIQDVARRAALAGYVALAPDLMSASGGTPDDEDKARVEFAKVDLAVARKDAVSALAYLKSRPDVSGRV